MAEKRDYYEVLGVKKDATAEEIKKAYRKVTKENHPDLHPGDKACEERFKEANEAYEVLSDEEKRKKYDQYGHANPNAPRRGDNIRAQLNISFEEAAFGCEKELNIPRIEPCADCGGTGCAPGTTPEVCPDCKGTGQVRTTQRTPFGMAQTMSACSKCRGTGKIIHQPCKTCRGMGSVRRAKKMTVKVPAGIDDGQTISKQGAGNAGANGGPAGDLLISVIVRPHAIFERDGTSVIMEQEITYAQAVLGAEVEVPTLDGKVKLTIPEGTQPGAVFRLRGKGIPYLRGSGRGDQFVSVKLTVPKNLSNHQKEALREFAAAMGETTGKSAGGIFGKKKH